MKGLSAGQSKGTCGRKYNMRRDPMRAAAVSVKDAAEASLKRRGLLRKDRVRPSESMANALLHAPFHGGGSF